MSVERRDAGLGYVPRPWQAQVHKNLRRFNVLVVHRRGGKTLASVMTLIDAALRTPKEHARYGYLAPFRNQAKSIAWDYCKRYGLRVPGATVNEGDLIITFPNDAQIRLFGADNADALRGLYFDGIVVDEVADIAKSVWDEILRPAIADREGWVLFIGTPKGVNLFSELYYDAVNDPEWYAGLFSYEDTKVLKDSEVESMRKQMSPQKFRQELHCDFSAANENALITMDMVRESCKRAPRESDITGSPRILGVDVARYGGDRSVICARQGLVMYKPQRWSMLDNMEFAAQVMQKIVEWKADACFIDAGRGEGVIDNLKQHGFSPIAVNFGGRPTKPGFYNRRAEIWSDLAAWMRSGGALPPDDLELHMDLVVPMYDYNNPRNVMALESKDDIRARGMRSPDLGDGAALTVAGHVMAKNGPEWAAAHSLKVRFATTEYDPYTD